MGCVTIASMLFINKITKERYDDAHYITWRGHEWSSKPGNNFQFIQYDSSQASDIYLMKNESLCLGSEHIDSVRYLYHHKKLWRVIVYVKTRENTIAWKINNFMNFRVMKNWRSAMDSINKDSSYVNTEKIVSYYNIKYESPIVFNERHETPKKYTTKDSNGYGWHINSTDKFDIYASEYRVYFLPTEGEIVYTTSSGEIEIYNEFKFIESRAKAVADSMAKLQSEIDKEKLKKEMGACGI